MNRPRWSSRQVYTFTALYALAASVVALDPMLVAPFDFSSRAVQPAFAAASLAAIACLLGAIAITCEDVQPFAGEV
jgi:hypothetical protein